MPEDINDRKVFSLIEVTRSIQKTLSTRYQSAFWVKAEMNKLNYYKHSGHCYPELVEKKDGKVIAQIRANLWKADFQRINTQFITILNEPLKDGIKILFQAKISFDPAYGLALWIIDIDPSYTLGDLEREKQEAINQLVKAGIFNKNKSCKLPLLPQRIAIISVETSKGYADFLKVIDSNSWNYKFFHFLFPALLQGDGAVSSIMTQLNKISRVIHHFDVVAIIRGGGGDVGLSCYNNYQLAEQVALFPIPIITGIGHATNETVVEMIAYENAITPTKLGEFLIQKFHNFSVPIQNAENLIIDKSRRLLLEESTKFRAEVKFFRSVMEIILTNNRNAVLQAASTLFQYAQFIFRQEDDRISNSKMAIPKLIKSYFLQNNQLMHTLAITFFKDAYAQISQIKLMISQQKDRLSLHTDIYLKDSNLALKSLHKNVEVMNPDHVLKRGYSITTLNGKMVNSITQVNNGDVIMTKLIDGHVSSTIVNINKTEQINRNE